MAQSLRNTAGLLLDLGPDVTDGEKRAIRQFMAGETEPMPAATGAQGFFTH